jgi:hypothetical protein
MAARKVTVHPDSGSPAGSNGSVVRRVGPAIPLAIPLVIGMLHGGLAGGPTGTPSVAAPTSMVQGSSLSGLHCGGGSSGYAACEAPYPMLAAGHPVDWFFVFKLNAAKFPLCGVSVTSEGTDARQCPFGGEAQKYTFGQQYLVASSEAPTPVAGSKECVGDTTGDPVGATFDEVYNGGFHYVVWNDQFYGDPKSASCGGEGCDSPWGHSKGMLAWNDAGVGMVMQVSTPSWPGSGSARRPRGDGNTLGCVKDDNVKVSQHFFALRLNKDDLVRVLDGLANASVVTDPANPQIVSSGGPDDVKAKVSALGVKSTSTALVSGMLSTGVELISKPSAMHVPPWQMVSSVLGGVPLRAATWWATPEIPSTAGGVPGCWDSSLTTAPGAVEIATTGTWKGTAIGLKGGISADSNHAKIGVSTTATDHYAIFGDMNQQGKLAGKCESSQNGRGGMFFVMQNKELSDGIAGLIAGQSAATAP